MYLFFSLYIYKVRENAVSGTVLANAVYITIELVQWLVEVLLSLRWETYY